ncbi:hypothetical protein [Methylocystis sp. ATCC 49242]|uniref:hypothetical protein n=1 Tax=Methylocystis sp. ATCC 49242 TaxID=622637 RepID=UPI0001F87FC3|nr:hypothetical protein [Methylocystis sp. ATCC 49242]
MKRAVFLSLVLAGSPAVAASPDAWEEFRANVKKACAKLAAAELENPSIWVDPFGTESYGVAIAKGPSKYDKSQQEVVCVFDKRSEKAEATSAFKR